MLVWSIACMLGLRIHGDFTCASHVLRIVHSHNRSSGLFIHSLHRVPYAARIRVALTPNAHSPQACTKPCIVAVAKLGGGRVGRGSCPRAQQASDAKQPRGNIQQVFWTSLQSDQNLRRPRVMCSRRCASPAAAPGTDRRTDGQGIVLVRLQHTRYP